MALVLNATKEFRTEMTPDSGGTNDRQFSEIDSLKSTEQGLFKCSFCPSFFPSLYHVQCHNIYKHSSLLKNNKIPGVVDPGNMDLTMSSGVSTDLRYESSQNDRIVVSQSGALDLSTVRCRESHDPKPNDNKVSSSNNDTEEESDNEESDKLVIDTQVETREREESSGQVTHHISGVKDYKTNVMYNKRDNTQYDRENSQPRPNIERNAEHRNFENNNPSNHNQAIDFRTMMPSFNPSKLSESSKLNDVGSYPPSMYSLHQERKYAGIENTAINQSLLGMIPPLPNMGMLGNFPMPFGFSPFMMMPPNSFMPPSTIGNSSEGRFSLPIDGFSNPTLNPNLNSQKSKAGPARRKISRSQKLNNEDKEKSVVEIYECKTCNRRFSQVGNFHNHMKTHDSKVCTCGICMMEFGDSYELQRHMRNTHTGSMPYKCEHCDREFSQYNNLRRHLRVHNGKNYKCHLCGRTFNEVFYLEMHMGSHTGERTYKCGVCNAIFSDNAELQKHVSTHSAEELHTCEVCGKSFSKACVLRQHKKMHSGVRPFKCEVCDKSFIHRHHLTIHSRMHSTNKPYTCNICKKEFAQTSHLYKHIQKHTEQPGITEEMIHQSLAPILERLKAANGSDNLLISDMSNNAGKNLSDALNNNMDTSVQSNQQRDSTLHSNDNERDVTLQPSHQERDLTLHTNNKEREITLQSNHSSNITVENEMKLVNKIDSCNVDKNKEISDYVVEQPKVNSPKQVAMKENLKTRETTMLDIHTKGEATQVEDKDNNERHNDTLKTTMTTKSLDNLYNSHMEQDKADHYQEKISESDDNASDKTSVSSTLSEPRYLNSPHSGLPYDEQCVHESRFPSIPSFHINRDTEDILNEVSITLNKDKSSNSEIFSKVVNTDRYSPISQSGESMSEEDFRSRSNSTCENQEPKNLDSTEVVSGSMVVSPRTVTSDSILKEQPIQRDNCPTKTEIIMPPKKRRRYTPRQKKKSQESTEHEETAKKYPQMIQPMAPEAQQMYFLQLQQMQMALAANVMAAHGMMMQNPSSLAKSFNTENQRGVPNGPSNTDSYNPIDLNLMRQPLTGSFPFSVNLQNAHDNHDLTVSPSMQNGS